MKTSQNVRIVCTAIYWLVWEPAIALYNGSLQSIEKRAIPQARRAKVYFTRRSRLIQG